MSAACDWHHPGADPYSGSKSAAVAYYSDIPAATRQRLVARMERNQFDQVVDIRRDSISGGFEPVIERMHFADGRVCATVDRSGWTAYEVQRAFVYCEDGHCLLEPFICHNVSYVRRMAEQPVAAIPPAFTFEPPAAGEAEATAPAAPHTAISTESFEAAVIPPAGYAAAWPVYGGGPHFGGGFPGRPGFTPNPGAVSPVPEPSTYALMLLGLAAITLRKRTMNLTRVGIAAALAACVALTACGGGGDEPKPTPDAQTCPINLAFASWGGCLTNEEAMKGPKP